MAAAYILGRNGFDVVVYEKMSKPYSNSTGAISRHLYNYIKGFIPLDLDKAIKGRASKIAVEFGGRHMIAIDGDVEFGYILEPNTFLNIIYKGITQEYPNVTFKFNTFYKDSSEFDYILYGVGASPSPQIGGRDLLHGFQVDISVEEPVEWDMRIIFDWRIAPGGYIWDFTLGCEGDQFFRRVGLAYQSRYRKYLNPLKSLSSILERLYSGYTIVRDLYGGLIIRAKPLKSNVVGRRIYIGDAGHFHDPLTGGGIGLGIVSGILAGLAISEGDIGRFEDMVSNIKRELMRRYWMKKFVYGAPYTLLYILAKLYLWRRDIGGMNFIEPGLDIYRLVNT